MRINHNISSITSQISLYRVNRETAKNLEKLSTGLRINSAADDAAGLGISENLRTQVRGLTQAMKNIQDVIAMLNIADGALNEQAAIMQRIRELVIQAKNDTYTDTERGYMGREAAQLAHELDRIAATANYNGMELFAAPEMEGYASRLYTPSVSNTPHKLGQATSIYGTGSGVLGSTDNGSSNHFNMWIGANVSGTDMAQYYSATQAYIPQADNALTIQFGQMDANALLSASPSHAIVGDVSNVFGSDTGIDNAFSWDPMPGGVDLEDAVIDVNMNGMPIDDSVQVKLDYLLDLIDGGSSIPAGLGGPSITGLNRINRMRSYIGSMINRLESELNNTINHRNNQQVAESILRDTDFAQETTQYAKNSILTRSATSMLAQSNMTPKSVLQLLR